VAPTSAAEGKATEAAARNRDVDLDLLLPTSVPRGGRKRFHASTDTEVSPSGLRHARQLTPGLPALPAWSGELQIGILGRGALLR
jgi:hypothetical protein